MLVSKAKTTVPVVSPAVYAPVFKVKDYTADFRGG